MFCAYTRPRYQVSVYRTIGSLVLYFLIKFLSANSIAERRRFILWRLIWDYNVCLCPIDSRLG